MEKQIGYPSIDRPWLKYYSDDAIKATLPECTIYEYLLEKNKDYPAVVAIIYLGRKITYGELFRNIDKTAAAFIKAGVKEKEIVTIALPSIPEAIYCVYALNKIGAVANMIHPLAGKEETVNYLNEVKSRIAVIFDGAFNAIANDISKTSVEKVIVASPADSLPLSLKILYNLKAKKPKLDGRAFVTWKQFIHDGKEMVVPDVKKDCHEMALISHTGGTTGEPKGVMCSDYSLNALMIQIVCNFKYSRNGCSIASLPPFVNYSLVESMMAMLAIGYKVVLIPAYEPTKLHEYFKKYHPTIVLSIPAYWNALVETRQEVDMSSLEQAYYGGEGMTAENERAVNELLKRCGAKTVLCKGLGATEMMAGATQSYLTCNPIGSVGIPLVKTNCAVVDPETGKELSYGESGELCFTGPTIMMGYYGNKKETEEVIRIREDGTQWFYSGDIGYITEDGVIYVTGRIKRIIMTKGRDGQVTKMFPDRIEKAICLLPEVELCCVIGVPDEARINYPKAFVVVRENDYAVSNLEERILSICKEKLPEYMIPESIEFRKELPRTTRGKVDYKALEEK